MAPRPKKPETDLSSELEFEEYAPQLRRLTPRLRPDTDIVPQTFRGETYFVLQDPVTLQFYRVAETEREILAQLDGRTALGAIHERLKAKFAADAPSFRQLAHFIFMLRQANLTVPEGDEESRWAVERAMKKRRQRLKQRLGSFMYLTIPLIDPERFLNAASPYVRWIFTRPFFVFWLLVIAGALAAFAMNARAIMQPANQVLDPGNLMYLWLSFFLIKTCHEFGHAFAAKHYGAEVHRMGVMFLIFMPCWYVDTTPIWAFPRKWPKALVGAAGMMTELLLASFALFAWLILEPGTLRTILYNMIFVASVSTVIFNGNPLLRYDAYYILADLIEIPNLRQHSSQYLSFLLKRHVIGDRVLPEAHQPREKVWFVLYGILAFIYRTIVVVGIILYIASKLLFVGVAMAAVVAVLWVLTPLVKMVKYLFFEKSTRRVRWRATLVFAAVVAAAVLVLGVVRVPTGVRTPCALEPFQEDVLRAQWPGFLTDVRVKNGARVSKGQVLAVVTNEELDYQIRRQELALEESSARLRALESGSASGGPTVGGRPPSPLVAEAQAEAYHLGMLRQDLETLRQRKDLLTFKAPFDGQVIAPNLDRVQGRFLQLGDELMTVASLDRLRVTAVVDDADIAFIRRLAEVRSSEFEVRSPDSGSRTSDFELRTPNSPRVRVKFTSDPSHVYEGTIERVHPSATNLPPPPALANAAGGSVLMDPKSPEGRRTLMPWWRVDILLDLRSEVGGQRSEGLDGSVSYSPLTSTDGRLPAGATGTARFVVGRDPIGKQVWLRFRQLLHRRFLV